MSVDNINIINSKPGIFYYIKNALIKHINKYQSKDYLYTFILGDKSLLDDNTYQSYQSLGVSHIFAISGMHISLLTVVLLRVLFFIKEKHRYIIIIVFLLFYIFITDYSASIIRTVTIFIFMFINKEYDYCLDNKKVYYLSISLILILNPYFLYNTGFLYSSIISYTLISYLYIINGNKIISLLKVSLLALLVSLPITINTNYEINILSVINNLIFVPLISLFIYPLSLITLIIKPLDIVFDQLMKLIETISSHMLICNVVIPKMNIIIIIIYYVLLYIFLNTYNKKYLLFILLSLLIWKYHYLIDNNYYVTYLDVGQGDSSIIRYKKNITMIDTGGKTSFEDEEWKKKKVYYYTDNSIKYLKSLGYSKINTLILTHGDFDHMGEANHLINNYRVDKVIFNCGPYNDLENELINELDNKHIKYYSCIKELDNMKFLNTNIYDNENDNSNVIYMNIYNHKLLFMGDAGITRERDILDKYDISNIDVLKVGHHGSKTSSGKDFIETIKPKYSIISVGKNNRYGHPNKEVLDILNGSHIYRTDVNGSVLLKINKNDNDIIILGSGSYEKRLVYYI